MKYPYLDINIDKIEENARKVVTRCQQDGIDVAGVTKVVCGLPKVARAMLRGGVSQLADSRLENLERMREDGIRADFMLLRLPMLSEVEKVVRLADISLNSELTVIKALSEAALQAGTRHRIVLMVDLGDLREGVLPRDTLVMARNILQLKGIDFHGIGANLACLSGVQPSSENLELLVHIANQLRERLSIPLPMVTGGNTFSLPLLVDGGVPKGINHFRLGASIILSASPTPEVLNLHHDTIQLHAEVLELKEKPSAPYGETGADAFGQKPVFEDRGVMKRVILGIGREDIVPEALFPVDHEIEILGASSDHLVVNTTHCQANHAIGGEVVFNLEYGALLAAMTSKYVHKSIRHEITDQSTRDRVGLLGAPFVLTPGEEISETAPDLIRHTGLVDKLRGMGLEVTDHGDLSAGQGEIALSQAVTTLLTQGVIPVVIGGPHSILHAELEGIRRIHDEFGMICFDAHGDLVTTILGDESIPMSLSLENFVIIGVRDLTEEESDRLEDSAITVFTMEEVDKLGMVEVVKQALDLACSGVSGVHISIDMDFIDMRDAPGVVEPEPGGISYREAHLAMELIAESKRLISMDITELHPSQDPAGVTVNLASSLIASLLGKRLLKRKAQED